MEIKSALAFSGVTSTGSVWRKWPESYARSVSVAVVWLGRLVELSFWRVLPLKLFVWPSSLSFYCSQAPLCGSLFLSWTFSCVLLLPSKICFLVIRTVYFSTYYGSSICSECLLLGFCFTHCSNTLFFSVALFSLTFPVAPFL